MTAVKVCLVLFALVAASLAQPQNDRGLMLNAILRKVLDKLRPSLKDLDIPDLDLSVSVPQAQVSFTFEDGVAKNLDRFSIRKLTTTVLPLKLTNLTLTLDDATLTGRYSLNGKIKPGSGGEQAVYGRGPAKLEFRGMFFTIASKFVLVSARPQIPPNGLYGFDLYLDWCKVSLDSLMDSSEKGEAVNKFFSVLILDTIRDNKHSIFQEYKEEIRCAINEYLAG